MSNRLALDDSSFVESYLARKKNSLGAVEQRNDNTNPSEWDQLGNRDPHEIVAEDDFNEQDHPRGQPGNAGQFGSGSGGGEKSESNEGHHTGEKHPSTEHHSAKGGALKLGTKARTVINSAVGKAVHHTKHKLKDPEFVKGAVSMGLAHIIEHYVPGAFMGGGYDEGAVGAYIEHIETVAKISAHQTIGLMRDALHGMIEAKKGIRGAHDAAEEEDDTPLEAIQGLIKVLEKLATKYEQIARDAAKVSKEEARYTDGPTDTQPCKRCVMFRDPNICTKVTGDIAPDGHCRFWYSKTAKDERLALDDASVRNFDVDGRLHITIANISKATVNPYLGKEIPDYEHMGLEPDRIYQLLRDPEELQRAASTFNGLPLLEEHKPTSAEDHAGDLVVGSTGTDAQFEFPYLRNSLVIWPEYAIEEVEDETKKELSCGYRYRADMTPGIFQGMKYDGIMRDIIGNHVALVKEGRAGADVVVGDSAENIRMAKPKMSRQAAVAIGFLSSVIRPKLAADAKIDLRPIFAGVTAKNFKEKKKGIVKSLSEALKDKLAQDATIGEVAELLDMIEAHGSGGTGTLEEEDALPPAVEPAIEKAAVPFAGEETPEEEAAEEGMEPPGKEQDMDEGDPIGQVEALLKGKVDDATLAQVCELMRGAPAGAHDELEEDANSDKGTGTGKGSPGGGSGSKKEGESNLKELGAADEDDDDKAEDEKDEDEKKATDKKGAMDDPPPFKGMPKPGGKMVTQDAMNAAIKAATEAASKNALKVQRDIREAERAVRPWVGDINIACDSAAAVYKTALKMIGVKNVDNIDPSAYQTILELHPMAGTRQKAQASEIAMDEASSQSYADRFPDAVRIGVM